MTNKKLNNIKNLTISFAYNPENVTLNDIISSYNSNHDVFSNTPWISSISINYPTNQSFELWEKVLELNITKNNQESEQLNIISANFTDINNEMFEPTTSWITF